LPAGALLAAREDLSAISARSYEELHFVPHAWMAGCLRRDLKDLRSKIAEDLAKRVQSAAKEAAGARSRPDIGK